MQIVIINGKGGSGKSTLAASLSQVIDADIIDHDNQGTLRITSSITGINKPVLAENVTKKIVIHDTPPYNALSFKSIIINADVILIPCNVSYADLVAITPAINMIREATKKDCTMIVFNRVRKPHNNTYRSIKQSFMNNFSDIKKAKTELSNLNAFINVFAQKLSGKALQEINHLYDEIKRYINIP